VAAFYSAAIRVVTEFYRYSHSRRLVDAERRCWILVSLEAAGWVGNQCAAVRHFRQARHRRIARRTCIKMSRISGVRESRRQISVAALAPRSDFQHSLSDKNVHRVECCRLLPGGQREWFMLGRGML